MKSRNPAPVAEPVNITEPTRIPLLPAEQKTLNLLAAVQNYPEVIDIRELARQLTTLVIQTAAQRSGMVLSNAEIEVSNGALLVRKD
jgi:stage III sporulation protein SpoIIIAA